MIAAAPGFRFLIIINNCPHLERWSVLQVSTVPCGKFQSLVRCYGLFLPFLDFVRGKGKHVQNGDIDAKIFSCFLFIYGPE
jgi:hypothetical protein